MNKPLHEVTLHKLDLVSKSELKQLNSLNKYKGINAPKMYVTNTHYVKNWIIYNSKSKKDLPKQLRGSL